MIVVPSKRRGTAYPTTQSYVPEDMNLHRTSSVQSHVENGLSNLIITLT